MLQCTSAIISAMGLSSAGLGGFTFQLRDLLHHHLPRARALEAVDTRAAEAGTTKAGTPASGTVETGARAVEAASAEAARAT